MHLSDSFTFDAELPIVWDLLMDIRAIGASIGMNTIQPVAGRSGLWRATLSFKWLFINSKASYLIQMSDVHHQHSYRLTVTGEGRQSLVNGTGLIRVRADGKRTILTWEADAKLAEVFRFVAQPVIRQAVSAISHTFFNRLAGQLRANGGQPATA
jgi:carbon monoxide dehydrogenase subunit G